MAVTLAPHLKEVKLEAMTNRDEYVPNLPEFEICKTRISHGCTPTQTTIDIQGIKSSLHDAKLLGKFFTCLASETTDNRNGTFLPKGSAHLLGPQTYKQVLKENNFFLTQVATIPVDLAYDTWFTIIDLNAASNIQYRPSLIKQPSSPQTVVFKDWTSQPWKMPCDHH